MGSVFSYDESTQSTSEHVVASTFASASASAPASASPPKPNNPNQPGNHQVIVERPDCNRRRRPRPDADLHDWTRLDDDEHEIDLPYHNFEDVILHITDSVTNICFDVCVPTTDRTLRLSLGAIIAEFIAPEAYPGTRVIHEMLFVSPLMTWRNAISRLPFGKKITLDMVDAWDLGVVSYSDAEALVLGEVYRAVSTKLSGINGVLHICTRSMKTAAGAGEDGIIVCPGIVVLHNREFAQSPLCKNTFSKHSRGKGTVPVYFCLDEALANNDSI